MNRGHDARAKLHEHHPSPVLATTRQESDSTRASLMSAPRASETSSPASASPALKKAWESYYAAIDEMRALLESTSMFKNPRDRAKAYHLIMEVQALVYNKCIAPRMATPRIHRNTGWQTDISAIGCSAPDMNFGLVYLDGTQTYRLWGNVGAIKPYLIQVYSHSFGIEGSECIGTYNVADMKVAADGTYEIIIGGPPKQHNWVALDTSSTWNFIMLRHILANNGHDDPGYHRLELIGELPPGYYDEDEFDEDMMAKRVHRAEMCMRVNINEFVVGMYDFAMAGANGQKNVMSLAPGLTITGGNPFCRYVQGVFCIEGDEALIIELDGAPEAVYWNLMLGDIWARALSFSRWQTALNLVQAKQDSDGHYRFVLSIKDPGVANWLDTTGRNEGIILFRNYITQKNLVPTVRKVRVAEIMQFLPRDTATVAPAQRKAALAHRREGFLKLYGE